VPSSTKTKNKSGNFNTTPLSWEEGRRLIRWFQNYVVHFDTCTVERCPHLSSLCFFCSTVLSE
jgi:hypothetical protein